MSSKIMGSETKDRKKLEEIIYVSWEESESGWGCRPDGCSLHLTKKGFALFEKDYWNSMPDEIPHEYSRPAGEPVSAYAGEELYGKIKESKNGIRIWEFQEEDFVKKNELIYGTVKSG